MNKCFKKIGNNEKISSWESKGLFNEVIKPSTTPNNIHHPELSYFINEIKLKFYKSCLKQDKTTYTRGTIVNIYIVDKLIANLNDFDFASENCLFGAVKLTKYADIYISTNIQDLVLDFM